MASNPIRDCIREVASIPSFAFVWVLGYQMLLVQLILGSMTEENIIHLLQIWGIIGVLCCARFIVHFRRSPNTLKQHLEEKCPPVVIPFTWLFGLQVHIILGMFECIGKEAFLYGIFIMCFCVLDTCLAVVLCRQRLIALCRQALSDYMEEKEELQNKKGSYEDRALTMELEQGISNAPHLSGYWTMPKEADLEKGEGEYLARNCSMEL